jgi:DNA-3-methyladenine glycosylase I
VERLLKDPSIVRNRLKVESVVRNAGAIRALGADRPLDTFLWSFVDGTPTVNRWKGMGDIPAETADLERCRRS